MSPATGSRWLASARRAGDPLHTGGEYRVFYLATRLEAGYVLHAFVKKRKRTPRMDVDLARTRLKELVRQRRQD